MRSTVRLQHRDRGLTAGRRTGARWRAQKSAALVTARTPIATCMCAAIGLLMAETTTRISGSAKSRRKSSTTNATRDARGHAAEPEGKQIEQGPWPGDQERRDPDPNRVHRHNK